MQQTQYIAVWKSGTAVRWRGLTWAEYRNFTQRLSYESPMEVYIDLYRAVLLDGPEGDFATAGIVDYVAKAMLETNPFGGQYEHIQHAITNKRGSQDWLEVAKALVAATFRYTFEEIDSWDADTFFDRVAKAEKLAGRTLDTVDPNKAVEDPRAANKPEGPPKRQKKPLTRAQQMVVDRVLQR